MSKSHNPAIANFDEWLAHPTTVALRQLWRRDLQTLKDRWAAGQFTDQHQFGTVILNAKAIGQCELLESLLNLEPEQLIMEKEDA